MQLKENVINRNLLLNIDVSKVYDSEERTFILFYRQIYNQYEAAKSNNEYSKSEEILFDLEHSEMFTHLVTKEQDRRGQEAFEAYREKMIKVQPEQIGSSQLAKYEALAKRIENRGKQSTEPPKICQKQEDNGRYQLMRPSNETLFAICTCLALALLYFIGIADLPYGYYTFLRVISLLGLATCVFLNYIEVETILNPVTFVCAPIAILFNPLAPIYLDKSAWEVLDLICGIAMIALAVFIYISYVRKHKNK